ACATAGLDRDGCVLARIVRAQVEDIAAAVLRRTRRETRRESWIHDARPAGELRYRRERLLLRRTRPERDMRRAPQRPLPERGRRAAAFERGPCRQARWRARRCRSVPTPQQA